jgi:hypothetical protein
MLNEKSTDPQHREALVSMTALYFIEEHALLRPELLEDAKKSLQALFLRTSGEETMLRKLIEILKTTKQIHQSFASISTSSPASPAALTVGSRWPPTSRPWPR